MKLLQTIKCLFGKHGDQLTETMQDSMMRVLNVTYCKHCMKISKLERYWIPEKKLCDSLMKSLYNPENIQNKTTEKQFYGLGAILQCPDKTVYGKQADTNKEK